jgi:hypothetical protein
MTARGISLALIVVGAVLIWPIDGLVAAVEVAAIGAILVAVGFGGALAGEASARRGTGPRPRR